MLIATCVTVTMIDACVDTLGYQHAVGVPMQYVAVVQEMFTSDD